MDEQFFLDLLGQRILAMRADLASIKADIGAMRTQLDYHQTELNVVAGLALRATGKRIAWSGVQASSTGSPNATRSSSTGIGDGPR